MRARTREHTRPPAVEGCGRGPTSKRPPPPRARMTRPRNGLRRQSLPHDAHESGSPLRGDETPPRRRYPPARQSPANKNNNTVGLERFHISPCELSRFAEGEVGGRRWESRRRFDFKGQPIVLRRQVRRRTASGAHKLAAPPPRAVRPPRVANDRGAFTPPHLKSPNRSSAYRPRCTIGGGFSFVCLNCIHPWGPR